MNSIKDLAFLLVLLGSLALSVGLSEQCQQERLALSSIARLTDSAPHGECFINLDVENSCSFDYAPISANFESICVEEGGLYYTDDLLFDCQVTVQGRRYDADYSYLNFPSCFGQSCDRTDIEEYYDNALYDRLKQQFAGDGIFCGAAPLSGVPSSVASIIFAVGSSLVAMAVLSN